MNNKHLFDDEFYGEDIIKILCERMGKTYEDMTSLVKQEHIFSPYLELGEEHCHRSLVMENDIGATVDISYDMLKSCDHYKIVFDKIKILLRICCDANALSFLSGSISFKCTNPDCDHEYFRPFSCKGWYLCPSCNQKRLLLFAEHLLENMLFRLPHRQFVFTVPKILRLYFKYGGCR